MGTKAVRLGRDTTRDNERMQSRRQGWLAANGPCVDCGSWNRLEVDHVNPADKFTHKVWSYSDEKRALELAKCVVRCFGCHHTRHMEEAVAHGRSGGLIGGKRYVENTTPEQRSLAASNAAKARWARKAS